MHQLKKTKQNNKTIPNILLFWKEHPSINNITSKEIHCIHFLLDVFFMFTWCHFFLLRLLFFYLNTFSPSSSFPHSPLSDQAYLQAAAVFQQLRPERTVAQQLLHYGKKTDKPQAESRDKATQRQAYQLAFNTLKCTKLIILFSAIMEKSAPFNQILWRGRTDG